LSPRSQLIAIPAACALLSGCFDYPAIGTLAGSMQQNIAAWQPFVDDYAASCERRLALVQNPADRSCDGRDDQAKQIAAAIKVLNNYFGALGAVATDSKFTLDDGLGSVGAEAQKLGAQPGQVSAISAVATTLADLAASGLRRRAMSQLIAQAGNVGEVVAVLKDIFDTVYRDNLNLEAAQWHHSLTHASSGLGLGAPPTCSDKMYWSIPPALSTAEQLQFEQFYQEQCAKLVARETALAQFDKSADQLKASLDKLRTSKLTDKALASALFTQAKALLEEGQAIEKAFNSTTTQS